MLSAENALHLSSSGGLTLARLSAVNTHVQGLPLSTNTKPFKAVSVTFQICFLLATAMKGCAQWGPVSVSCLCKMKRNSSNKISFGNGTFLDSKFLYTEGHFFSVLVLETDFTILSIKGFSFTAYPSYRPHTETLHASITNAYMVTFLTFWYHVVHFFHKRGTT